MLIAHGPYIKHHFVAPGVYLAVKHNWVHNCTYEGKQCNYLDSQGLIPDGSTPSVIEFWPQAFALFRKTGGQIPNTNRWNWFWPLLKRVRICILISAASVKQDTFAAPFCIIFISRENKKKVIRQVKLSCLWVTAIYRKLRLGWM